MSNNGKDLILNNIKRAFNVNLRSNSKKLNDLFSDHASFSKLLDIELPQTIDSNINTKIPVLRFHTSTNLLKFEDFQNLDSNIELKYVIKGRYPLNLVYNNDYFLFFNSVDDLKNYYLTCKRKNYLLNGLRLNIKPIDYFVNYLRFLYPNFLPDLRDLQYLISISSGSNFIKKDKKFNSVEKSLQNLLDIRLNYLEKNKRNKSPELIKIANALKSVKSFDNDNDSILIDRSCCVVFSNVPANISTTKIYDFFWDLSWSKNTSKRIRSIYTDKTTNFTTYVLAFDDNENAEACVLRANNQPLFYDINNPIVSAQIL